MASGIAGMSKIVLGSELELIGYRVDALPAASQPLRLTLLWRGVRPADSVKSSLEARPTISLAPSTPALRIVSSCEMMHGYGPHNWRNGMPWLAKTCQTLASSASEIVRAGTVDVR